jgi:hypothetical protein
MHSPVVQRAASLRTLAAERSLKAKNTPMLLSADVRTAVNATTAETGRSGDTTDMSDMKILQQDGGGSLLW